MKRLHEWFERNKRDFPWRRERTPYTVWVSEIMLQQTRASVVIPYFLRWLSLFPDVEALAAAPLETVIKAWEGLGYYSRARNLHAGAQEIAERFGGRIPSRREELQTIRGIGSYTLGAILSFGFQQRAPAVDGNVARVIARLFCIEENISRQPVKRRIEAKTAEILDAEQPWVTSEALIELGATLCAPKPRCGDCPLQEICLAYRDKKAESLPIKNAPPKTTELRRAVAVIEAGGKILVRKGRKGQLMADLYEFPYFELEGSLWSREKFRRALEKRLGIKTAFRGQLSEVRHTFTRFKAHLFPSLFQAEQVLAPEGYAWVAREKILEIPFSSGHRKIAHEFLQR